MTTFLNTAETRPGFLATISGPVCPGATKPAKARIEVDVGNPPIQPAGTEKSISRSGGTVPTEMGGDDRETGMPKEDPVLKRILAFNDAKGGGVVVRKAARGYSLFREDNGRPVARLRPTGKGDMVEVMWWSHRDKWDQIGDFGPFVMSLDEALDYVSRDPMGVFWG